MQFRYLPDGGAEYTTSDGDVLDLVAFRERLEALWVAVA